MQYQTINDRYYLLFLNKQLDKIIVSLQSTSISVFKIMIIKIQLQCSLADSSLIILTKQVLRMRAPLSRQDFTQVQAQWLYFLIITKVLANKNYSYPNITTIKVLLKSVIDCMFRNSILVYTFYRLYLLVIQYRVFLL